MNTSRTLLILASISCMAAPNFATASSTRHFKVTLANGMAANVLSPFLLVALPAGKVLFEVGKPATPGIATLAETGNTSPLEKELAQDPTVIATAKAQGGPTFAGDQRSVEIELSWLDVERGATLNLVSMIGRSNDSFVALNSFPLRRLSRFGKTQIGATNYDAGSEENSGNLADFGPNGHPVQGAEGHISFDRGLNPRGDAPDTLSWGPNAGLVTLEETY